MVSVIVLWQTACTWAALEHLAAGVARLTPARPPAINLDGRYRTTSRPPATGLRPLRTDGLRILYRSSSQAITFRPAQPALPRPAGRLRGLVDGVLGDDVGGLAPWGVRAGQLRVALMIFRGQ
jgi:hypothetical protein